MSKKPRKLRDKSSILIVDDQITLLKQLVPLLRRSLPDVSISSASSVSNAIKKFRKFPFNLIILDMKFRNNDGLNLLSALRRQGLRFRVIVYTAYSRKYVTQATKNRVDDFIPKSSDFAPLIDAIQNQLNEINKERGKGTVFCLMPFNNKFDDIYEFGIKRPIESLGYSCNRIDEKVFTTSILQQIHKQIKKAIFIVADLTSNNPNVYYEVGYAHAINMQRVVLVAQSANRLKFDVKGIRCIVYAGKISKLAQEITKSIRELEKA